MNKHKQLNKKIFILIGAIIILILAIAIAIIACNMQIKLNAPNNVTINETEMHTIQLSWDAVEHATSYEVSIYEESEQKPIETKQIDTTEITLEGLLADHSYEISVIANYDKKDKHIESKASDRVSAKTTRPEPEMVEGLKAESKSTSSIELQWTPYETKDVNADGTPVNISYTILYSTTQDGAYEILAENLDEAKYVHEALLELDTYYYKVIVEEQMDGNEYLGQENNTSVTATAGIGTVSGLVAEGISESKIKISWDAYVLEKVNDDGTPITISYSLYVSDSEAGEFAILANEITDAFYEEENLSPETVRYYKVSVTAQKNGNDIIGEQTGPVSAMTKAKKTTVSSQSTNAYKEAQARVVAQQIADSITGSSELEKIRQAAEIVASYCMNSTYTSSDPDYRSAYGLFCKGVYTCAGSTRALGMVLECMGYSWEHVNANQWTHQWCRVMMDGQEGWADGMSGIADYGECPFATGGIYIAEDGTIYFVP